jgi:hypothetical protein
MYAETFTSGTIERLGQDAYVASSNSSMTAYALLRSARKLLCNTNSTKGTTIDLSAQPPGHYYARAETQQGLRMVHLVVAR